MKVGLKKKSGKSWILILSGVISGILSGLLGTGGGMIIVPALQKYGISQKSAHATAILIILPVTVLSACFYAFTDGADYTPMVQLVPAGIIGGFLGARFLVKLNGLVLRLIFTAILAWAAFKMLVG